jgi:hypothetical protein
MIIYMNYNCVEGRREERERGERGQERGERRIIFPLS